MVTVMPMPKFTISVPFPGCVDIDEMGMKMRFNEQSLKEALSRAKANPQAYASEETYKHVVEMYEAALKLLEEEKA